MTAASDYGTFRLTYTPPEPTGREDYPLITVEMSTSGDANVDQMLRFYEAFLAASGFSLKGDLQVVEPERDPWGHMTVRGSQATDFVPFSNLADDVISFGSSPAPSTVGSYSSAPSGAVAIGNTPYPGV